ncbi:MAG: ATP-binding protein [Flammeovirgaceae bacterium]|nr:MAG: ATP-binding protein [Flammeovirgaceae bacterium]
MFKRRQEFFKSGRNSFFLWGVRQSGKSTLLKERYGNALYFDLLLSDVYRRLLNNPEQFRESVLAANPHEPVIVDEIQKLPALLNEVHWLIENKKIQFILSGSTPRKILKQGVNLLGGRALRYQLYPLSFSEIPDFNLIKALNNGLLPRHYLAEDAGQLIDAYIGSYLEDEIVAETKIRNTETFSRFLNKAAFSNGEIINYTNIAADCGVSSPTIKEYFSILEDTLIGDFVPSFQKNPKRRTIAAPKFYFFDVGIVNTLLRRKSIEPGSVNFGFAFEHFIFHELKTYSQYSGKKFPIHYWRTSSQFEVDFVLGDHEVAVEVKSTDNVHLKHTKGLNAFSDEYKLKSRIIVSLDPLPRTIASGITVLPWREFLNRLWAGVII